MTCKGCEARKEIMFTHGKLGAVEVGIIATTMVVLVATFVLRKG